VIYDILAADEASTALDGNVALQQRLERKTITGGGSNEHVRHGNRGIAGHIRFDALDQSHIRHYLHDDDRQPPVWLDAVRQSDQ
jgi:hypothetical protein